MRIVTIFGAPSCSSPRDVMWLNCVKVNVNREYLAWLKQPINCCKVHHNVVQKFKLKFHEMTGETRTSLAVAGRKRQTVQTAHQMAECSRKWRLRQETSDGRLLTDGTAGRAAAAWTTTADANYSFVIWKRPECHILGRFWAPCCHL